MTATTLTFFAEFDGRFGTTDYVSPDRATVIYQHYSGAWVRETGKKVDGSFETPEAAMAYGTDAEIKVEPVTVH